MQNRSILLYDFLLVKGGAESVSLQLLETFPELEGCFGFITQPEFSSTVEQLAPRIKTLCNPTTIPGWQTLKVANAFKNQTRFLSNYSTVIYSGSNSPLAVYNQASGKRLYYCHTPPRFIYDLKDYYLNSLPLWQKPLLHALVAYFQPEYEKAVAQMDHVFVNSTNVKRRVKSYLGIDADVVYPPCNTTSYKWEGQGNYYLSSGRLESYKRIDRIIDAFRQLPDKNLVIASGGSQAQKLRRHAKNAPNIHFTGWASQSEMSSLMNNCIASIYIPIDEDFGMSPVESMAAGKPVIGVDDGGVRETVLHERTGILCSKDCEVWELIDAVNQMTPEYAISLRKSCEERAQFFSAKHFFKRMSPFIRTR